MLIYIITTIKQQLQPQLQLQVLHQVSNRLQYQIIKKKEIVKSVKVFYSDCILENYLKARTVL